MNYFLHGNIGSTSDWDGFDGRAVDLWADSNLCLSEWAAHFCERVRTNNSESNHLIGYSMGGRLALHALLAEPDLWASAIIIGAHPGLHCEEERAARCGSDAVWAELARDEEWPVFLEKWNAQGVLAKGEPSTAQLSLQSRREEIAQGFENWSLGKQENLREQLQAMTTRVLWITGERDEKFSSIGMEMAESMQNCEHVRINNCGHRVIFEQPELLKKVVHETCC